PRRDTRRGSLPKTLRLLRRAARRLRHSSLTWLPLHIWDHLLPCEPSGIRRQPAATNPALTHRTTFVRSDVVMLFARRRTVKDAHAEKSPWHGFPSLLCVDPSHRVKADLFWRMRLPTVLKRTSTC